MTRSYAGVLARGNLRLTVGVTALAPRGRTVGAHAPYSAPPPNAFLVCLRRQLSSCRYRKCSWKLCVPSVDVCCPDNHVSTVGFIPSLRAWSTVPACRPFGRPRPATYAWRADDRDRHCRFPWHFLAATSSRLTQSGSMTPAVLVLPLTILGGHYAPPRCNVDRKRCCFVRAAQ